MDITLSQAIEGYLIYAEARGLSPHTLRDYITTFTRFQKFTGDIPISDISKRHIENFMASLSGLKKKTRVNYHIGLSALWTWMVNEELVTEHIVRQVRPPKPEQVAIEPFSEQDIKLLLASLQRSKSYRRPRQRERSSHSLTNATRNKAIILLLLDTGIRASELCNLKIKDVDLRNRHVKVFGKGSKGRTVPISAKTAKVIWQYLIKRKGAAERDPLFVSAQEFPLGRGGLRRLLKRLGERAGVVNVHPHRFRHTFAIQYLRNLGDTETLQRILGHSDLGTVKRYLAIAKSDVDLRHRSASPVANWNID